MEIGRRLTGCLLPAVGWKVQGRKREGGDGTAFKDGQEPGDRRVPQGGEAPPAGQHRRRQIEDEGSDAAEREALFRKVEASVDSELTELQKLIVRKHEYEGQSFERIAKDLGMRQEAVRMHISRARKILRDKFRNETDE